MLCRLRMWNKDGSLALSASVDGLPAGAISSQWKTFSDKVHSAELSSDDVSMVLGKLNAARVGAESAIELELTESQLIALGLWSGQERNHL